jgi:hypothetical protein
MRSMVEGARAPRPKLAEVRDALFPPPSALRAATSPDGGG